jgi:hypothetical protein
VKDRSQTFNPKTERWVKRIVTTQASKVRFYDLYISGINGFPLKAS